MTSGHILCTLVDMDETKDEKEDHLPIDRGWAWIMLLGEWVPASFIVERTCFNFEIMLKCENEKDGRYLGYKVL